MMILRMRSGRLFGQKLLPPKVQAFLWKVVKGRIPTGSELKKRGIKVPCADMCILCSREEETIGHLFLSMHVDLESLTKMVFCLGVAISHSCRGERVFMAVVFTILSRVLKSDMGISFLRYSLDNLALQK
ncbi:hypothetical protein GQ457_15G024600 [Hibiscus cannabinus]